jgi:hypothetical protein
VSPSLRRNNKCPTLCVLNVGCNDGPSEATHIPLFREGFGLPETPSGLIKTDSFLILNSAVYIPR